jgi:hypothetical protein
MGKRHGNAATCEHCRPLIAKQILERGRAVTTRKHRQAKRIFLSWDAAPWHSSKALLERVAFLNEWAPHESAPEIILVPLPTGAQFLNVIESVFSGMARAIIHNSDYKKPSQPSPDISRSGTTISSPTPAEQGRRSGRTSGYRAPSTRQTTARTADIGE